MRWLPLLSLPLAVACEEPAKPPSACQQLEVCFYGSEEATQALAEVADGRYAGFADGRDEMIAAYGAGGTCYDGGDVKACEARCLCALAELCSDKPARELTCTKERCYPANRCCDTPELRAFEEERLGEGGVQPDSDDLDKTCELPLNRTIPDRFTMCSEEFDPPAPVACGFVDAGPPPDGGPPDGG